MRIIGDGQAPAAAEHSASKRRHSSLLRPCHLHETSKKRRSLTETETLTLEPSTTHTPPLRTKFAASSHSSFRTHHKHKKHHRIKSSTSEGDRKWVYSSRSNPSHYKGIIHSCFMHQSPITRAIWRAVISDYFMEPSLVN